MRRKAIETALLSMLLMLSGSGCEDRDSSSEGYSDSLAKMAKSKETTVCEFGVEALTTGQTYSVSIKNDRLKEIKEKDLQKKGYLVEVELGGSTQTISGTVKNKGEMIVQFEANAEGPGTVIVYENDLKKNKRNETARCAFLVEPPACRCPEGLVCEDESGECVGCNSSGDCLEEGAPVCIDNTCVECSDNNQCSDRQLCEDNACVDVECVVDGHCLDRQLCKDNVCTDVECTINSHCGDRQICENNSCADVECTDDSQCTGDLRCFNNTCAEAECTNSGDCPSRQVCGHEGQCVELPEECASHVEFEEFLCDSRSHCVDWALRDLWGCEGIASELLDLRVDCNPCPDGQRCGRKDSKCYEVDCVPRTCEEAALAGDVPNCPLFCQSVNNGCGAQMNCCEFAGPPQSDWDAWRDRVLVLFNKQRAVGATCGDQWFPASAPLVLNEAINAGAQEYALEMLSTGIYRHDPNLPPGLAENIAINSTPESVVDAWLASPGHCSAIMNGEHRYVGVGFARYYWVSRFSK